LTQNANTPPPAAGQTPPPGDLPGQTPPTPQGQTPLGQQQQQQNPLTDHWTEEDWKYFRRLRKENETANEQAKAANEQVKALAKAKQEAEDAKLREQGEYKQLAEKHEQRVKELEPVATRYNTLVELMKAQLDAQIKGWPDEITFSDPGPDADILARLAWADKARPRAEKLLQQQQGQAPGNSPNPQPAGQMSKREGVEELTQRLRAQRGPVL
jgi:hypothetical protein